MRSACLLFAVLISLILLPPSSSADMKIILKNGRTITADRCRDALDRLVCEKIGGTFEIPKEQIEDFREFTVRRQEPENADASQEEQPESFHTASEGPDKERTETRLIRGMFPAEEERLDRIRERKEELLSEREKLTEEQKRLRLETDVPAIDRTDEEIRDINERVDGLEKRIAEFNREVRALNEEEKKILQELREKAASSPPKQEE